MTLLVSLSTLTAAGFTWMTIRQANTEQQLARDGQVTDRYTAAVANLGDTAEEVRIGGMYALQRIAQDSPRDAPTVVQVLSAYVRSHTPDARKSTAKPDQPANDVQAALTILAAPLIENTPVDLHDADIHGANLRGADLEGANLDGANLGNAHLESTDLHGANLDGANLENAVLDSADLDGANLHVANLKDAHLAGAHLTDAILSGADLFGADLAKAKLHGAILGGPLSAVQRYGPSSIVADLGASDLRGADLSDADLSGVDISGANLDGANLTGAKGYKPLKTPQPSPSTAH
ncbi:pentapeptide repeat-containing protein [Streptomyces cynarae]|uniref:Pentapeptide repeat-containing protein n=1 Tax=Streptomyces cynarae TaxID=2981134 RepID=A0ABY6EG26_9ACTN|nr:pentapeptide repeat-containing protein [Streptomyces cynarae]UXY24231.1 pentapeptide repeat-containing protein [Streptomyces cynarae]